MNARYYFAGTQFGGRVAAVTGHRGYRGMNGCNIRIARKFCRSLKDKDKIADTALLSRRDHESAYFL